MVNHAAERAVDSSASGCRMDDVRCVHGIKIMVTTCTPSNDQLIDLVARCAPPPYTIDATTKATAASCETATTGRR